MDMVNIIGSLWEYGALIVVLAGSTYVLWQRCNYLQDQLIQLIKDYTEAMNELTNLIKGDTHDDTTDDR